MNVVLARTEVSKECIRGWLFVDGKAFATLEPPWRENRSNVSAVCPGDYRASYLLKSRSGKYRRVYVLAKVPGRLGILIHAGNLAEHTRGCILIGKRWGVLAGQRAIVQSRTALEELRRIVGVDTFEISIVGNQQC